MTTRELPRDEWHRLESTDLGAVMSLFPVDSLVPIVVEDETGQIVGCWGILNVLHVEGLWIAPEHRKQTGVARRLLVGMRTAIIQRGTRGVLTGANAADVEIMLEKVGAVRVPYGSYYWPVS